MGKDFIVPVQVGGWSVLKSDDKQKILSHQAGPTRTVRI